MEKAIDKFPPEQSGFRCSAIRFHRSRFGNQRNVEASENAERGKSPAHTALLRANPAADRGRDLKNTIFVSWR